MADNKRKRQLSSQIQKTLAEILLYYATREPSLTKVTILDVDVAPDLATTKIFVSVLNSSDIDITMQVLGKHAKQLRHLLAKRLNLRITPSLTFLYDDTIVKGQKLSTLINSAVAADEQLHSRNNSNHSDEK